MDDPYARWCGNCGARFRTTEAHIYCEDCSSDGFTEKGSEMRVWLIMNHCCGQCGRPIAVYSSRERAEAAIREMKNDPINAGLDLEISEWPVG